MRNIFTTQFQQVLQHPWLLDALIRNAPSVWHGTVWYLPIQLQTTVAPSFHNIYRAFIYRHLFPHFLSCCHNQNGSWLEMECKTKTVYPTKQWRSTMWFWGGMFSERTISDTNGVTLGKRVLFLFLAFYLSIFPSISLSFSFLSLYPETVWLFQTCFKPVPNLFRTFCWPPNILCSAPEGRNLRKSLQASFKLISVTFQSHFTAIYSWVNWTSHLYWNPMCSDNSGPNPDFTKQNAGCVSSCGDHLHKAELCFADCESCARKGSS